MNMAMELPGTFNTLICGSIFRHRGHQLTKMKNAEGRCGTEIALLHS